MDIRIYSNHKQQLLSAHLIVVSVEPLNTVILIRNEIFYKILLKSEIIDFRNFIQN